MKHKRRAQAELYHRFSYMMNGICLRYSSDEDEAKDLLQESFIKVFKNLEKFSGDGPLGAWMRRIAVNTSLENYRKKHAVRTLDLVYEDGDETYIDEDEIFHEMDVEVLMNKIQKLPMGFKTVFNLYAIEGYNHAEIAEMLNISTGTSKSQYSRARVILKKMILEDSVRTQKMLRYGE
ncbi:MAG: sigma-70 family RNA polymerase sigma factor [Crocinitomicaceae bacterium]|nr:sigma-70 family RNA polymerase sigma factor [Crocinitomicaceae bacterium]